MSDSTGAPEPDRRAVLVLDAHGLRIEPADATDTDFDPAADLPWGADDPNPPVPTGDHDEVTVPADTPTPGDSGAPLDLDSIRHRLSEVRGARAGRWDFHRAIGSTLTFNAHAARDVEVLLAEVDRLAAEHTTHLLGVGHPMWLPSVADVVDHPDPFNATPSEVLDRVRAVVAERDELAARVEQLSDRVTAAEGRLELAAMAGGGAK